MYIEEVIVSNRGEISFFRDELADEFVGVLDKASLPRGIGVHEEHFGMEHPGDVFVVVELGTVVGGDRQDMSFERAEQLYDMPCHGLGILAFGTLGYEELLRGAIDEGDEGALAVSADDGVHLPVPET